MGAMKKMNKYQEAIYNLSFPRDDACCVGCKCGESDCDCERRDWVIALEELVDKQEKYRWHDLRKNPDDLPPINPKNTYENDVYLYVEYDFYGIVKRRYFIGHLRSKEPYVIKNEKGDDNFWGISTYETNWCIWDLSGFYQSKVIAWKYIEEFENED